MDEGGSDGEAITVIRVAEAEIGANLSRDLQSLLQMCFPGYPSRSYFKLPAFVVLFADDDRLYTRNGWARVSNRCSWVRIDKHATLGIARQADPGAMMVKAIGEQAWPEDDVDLLGHLF